jgi:protein phosphatase
MLATGQVDPWFIMFFGLTLIVGVGLGCFLPFRRRTVVQETKFLIQGSGTPFAVLSDIGKRAQNEDSVAIEFTRKSGAIHDRQCSIVVADGVSGESEGKTASSLAVNTILAHIGASDRRDEEVLRAALIEANRAIINQSTNKLQGQRLASTAVVAIISRNEIALGSVGDSRAYLFRNGKLYRLTKDDTVTQGLLDARRISEAEAEHHPERHKLTKALGQKPELDPAVGTYEAAKGDVLLCCSDGLTDGLADTGIASIMRGAQDMEKLSETLVQYAKSAGSQDNVTVALLRID